MPRITPPRPPRPPRTSSALRAPRPPRLPPLRLSPIRPQGSVELDRVSSRSGSALPPFVRWDHWYPQWTWASGEHVSTVGPTGVGKTLLNRYLLRKAPTPTRAEGPFVVVFGIKNRDRELYGPFEREGYKLVRKFDAEPDDDEPTAHYLFVPISSKHGTEARREKGAAFRQALHDIEDAGGWTVYLDDTAYLNNQLGLEPELVDLWTIGRSLEVQLVASTQEPVFIPVIAYSAATHLFLFHNPDLYRARRMAEFSGVNREVALETILRLPPHEFLYINKNTAKMLRSTVIR